MFSCQGGLIWLDMDMEQFLFLLFLHKNVLIEFQQNMVEGLGRLRDGGFLCGNRFCIALGVWCNIKQIDKSSLDLVQPHCPELLATIQNKDLCQNQTFWKSKSCGSYGSRSVFSNLSFREPLDSLQGFCQILDISP